MNTRLLPASATALVVGVLAVGLTACSSGSSDSSGGSSGSASASASASKGPDLVANVASLTGQTTSVALSTTFTDALSTLKLTPGVVGTAKLENGSLVFPITGGNVKYYTPGTRDPYVIGDIQHQGSGITLTGGSTVVTLQNFDIDPGGSRLYGDVSANGAPVGQHLYLFNLDGSTLKPLQTDQAAGTATLTGTRVLVSPDAADLLNKTFNTTAVTDTLEVGIATIVINAG